MANFNGQNLVPNPREAAQICLNNFLAINLPSQPFLGHHLEFQIFLLLWLALEATHLLYFGCFELD